MTKLKQNSGIVHIGLDKHLKNWVVSLQQEGQKKEVFHTADKAQGLINHLEKHYPNTERYCAHEAGFCGFSAHRELEAAGIHSIMVNAADIATTSRERKRKDDKQDALKLLAELQAGRLSKIYIPTEEEESFRGLDRFKEQLTQKIVQQKNQIRASFYVHGEEKVFKREEGKPGVWSRKFNESLRKLKLSETRSYILNSNLDHLDYLIKEKKRILKELTKRVKEIGVWKELDAIEGISGVTLCCIIAETMNIDRFEHTKNYRSFIGLVPDTQSSGERDRKIGLTKRANHGLRKSLIGAAWVAVRVKDSRYKERFDELCKTMKSTKAIIKIAGWMANRIWSVWKNYKAEQGSRQDKEELEQEQVSSDDAVLTATAKVTPAQTTGKVEPFGSVQKNEEASPLRGDNELGDHFFDPEP